MKYSGGRGPPPTVVVMDPGLRRDDSGGYRDGAAAFGRPRPESATPAAQLQPPHEEGNEPPELNRPRPSAPQNVPDRRGHLVHGLHAVDGLEHALALVIGGQGRGLAPVGFEAGLE